mgnify:CR=1 FL=1
MADMIYVLPIAGLTALTAVPFAQLATPATTCIEILWIELGQETSETSQQEILTLIHRSTASTLPTSTTPVPYFFRATAIASLLTGSTTTNAIGIATVTGTAVDTIQLPPFNALNSFLWYPPKPIPVAPSRFVTLQFKTAPAANTWSGGIFFRETS